MWFLDKKKKIDNFLQKMENADQTPRFVASDLGLHYLPPTLLGCPD